MSGVIQDLSFCDQLFSLSVMSSRSIHAAACVRISFLFQAEYYSIVCLYHVLFIHSFIHRHTFTF